MYKEDKGKRALWKLGLEHKLLNKINLKIT